MTKDEASAILCGLVHDGTNADKLSRRARQQIRTALEVVLTMTRAQNAALTADGGEPCDTARVTTALSSHHHNTAQGE